MAIAQQNIPTHLLTYEEYLAEGEVNKRYDIIDGVRYFMANPTWRHQRISKNLSRLLDHYELTSGNGKMIYAPLDVLIHRRPLRTRQPDLLFITDERLGDDHDDYDPKPLATAPELVIEILSPSDTRRVRNAKIADYCAIGVQECWIVSPEAETVEILQMTPDGDETVEIYGNRQTLQSVVFTDLAVSVAEIFAD